MKSFVNLLFCLLLTAVFGCGGDAPDQTGGTDAPADTTSTVPPADTTTGGGTPDPVKPDCQIAGKVLPGNEFWAKDQNLFLAISAGKETEDPSLGESHRILEVFDGKTCQQVFREILPVNLSADYPYYISEITYNNVSKVVAIRGFQKVYVFDLANRRLLAPLLPKFLNERYTEDAHSGMIDRLELWETYIVGHAASLGAFVFDLGNPQQPKAVLPFAEYELEKGSRYNSLFLLKSLDAANGWQAFLPSYDPEKQDFIINPLFDQPRNMEVNFNKSFKNNRHLVLKELTGGSTGRPVAIDMSKQKLVELPPEVAAKKDTEIIEWMKKQ